MEGFCAEPDPINIIRSCVTNSLPVVRDDDVTCHVLYLVTQSVHEYRNNVIKYVTSTVLSAVHTSDSRQPENIKVARMLSSTVIIIIDGYSVKGNPVTGPGGSIG
jgi:hypothetical protein